MFFSSFPSKINKKKKQTPINKPKVIARTSQDKLQKVEVWRNLENELREAIGVVALSSRNSSRGEELMGVASQNWGFKD